MDHDYKYISTMLDTCEDNFIDWNRIKYFMYIYRNEYLCMYYSNYIILKSINRYRNILAKQQIFYTCPCEYMKILIQSFNLPSVFTTEIVDNYIKQTFLMNLNCLCFRPECRFGLPLYTIFPMN